MTTDVKENPFYADERDSGGSMVCVVCGSSSSARTCLANRETIGFLTGVLQGVRWRVDSECRKMIEDALDRVEKDD